jgi:hypothetical protein
VWGMDLPAGRLGLDNGDGEDPRVREPVRVPLPRARVKDVVLGGENMWMLLDESTE